jgi:hypothetical protein
MMFFSELVTSTSITSKPFLLNAVAWRVTLLIRSVKMHWREIVMILDVIIKSFVAESPQKLSEFLHISAQLPLLIQ